MKVYVLQEDGAFDGESFTNVIGVYYDKEKAQAEMKETIRTIKKQGFNNVEQEGDSYSSWLDGEYTWNHWDLKIYESEIK